MRILVLGGTRFIGLAAVTELARAGHDVAVFHRGASPASLPEGVTEILGDRDEIERHAKALFEFNADVMLDMFAFTEANMRRVVDLFAGRVPRLVVVSSCDVYRAYGVLIGKEQDCVQPIPLAEDAELRPVLYPFRGAEPRAPDDPRSFLDDYEKILVEQIALSAPGMQSAVLRLPMVYGPRDGQHRLFPYLKRIDDGRLAIILAALDAKRRFSHGYVENVTHAIALAVTSEGAQGVYNVADEPALTELEWVSAIANATGWPGRIVIVPDAALPENMRGAVQTSQELVVSTERIRDELGFSEIVPSAEGLRRTIEWERANPPAQFDHAQFDYAAEDVILAGLPRAG